MEIKNYSDTYFEDVFEIIHKTIEEIYPKYYPRGAVDFFHNHHSKENMKEQLPYEFTLVVMENLYDGSYLCYLEMVKILSQKLIN